MMFSFSSTLHYPGIVEVIDKTHSKSITKDGCYRMALLEPVLGKTKQVFNIKHTGDSTWVGIGICHKEKVIINNYDFSFSTLDHGTYVMSSNAGVFSCLEEAKNNCVKGFTFKKNDVIKVTYDPINFTLTYTKEDSDASFEFEITDSEDYHPCIVYYFQNDTTEIINEIKYVNL